MTINLSFFLFPDAKNVFWLREEPVYLRGKVSRDARQAINKALICKN